MPKPMPSPRHMPLPAHSHLPWPDIGGTVAGRLGAKSKPNDDRTCNACSVGHGVVHFLDDTGGAQNMNRICV